MATFISPRIDDATGRSHRRLASRLLVVVLAAVTASVAVNSTPRGPAAAAGVGRQTGVVSDITWFIPRPDMDRSIAMMASAGVQWVRTNVNWASVEPHGPGQLDQWWLDELDYAMGRLREAGISVLMPIADGVPYWASADPAKYEDGAGRHWNRYWKPNQVGDYASFVERIVARYTHFGVKAYEVWNEPNFERFWPSGPSAPDYAALLSAAARAIRSADPAAQVVLGGLSTNDHAYLQALYEAGAGAFFDVVAVHPYGGSFSPDLCWNQAGGEKKSQHAICGIEEVHATMAANGDGSKSIWLTELGWSTAAASVGVSEVTQAEYLTTAFAQLDAYPYVTHAFWYSFRNNWWQNDDPSEVEANYGLVRRDFSPKPALAAFRAVTGR